MKYDLQSIYEATTLSYIKLLFQVIFIYFLLILVAFIRFDTIPVYDRQTHTQTDRWLVPTLA